MQGIDDSIVANDPAFTECVEYTNRSFADELARLELGWASVPSQSLPVGESRERASETLDEITVDEAQLAEADSLSNDEPPAFLEFEAIPDSPLQECVAIPTAEPYVHEVPVRLVDYVAGNGDRVVIDMGNEFLGRGAVAAVYSGSVHVVHAGDTEHSQSDGLPVACRVQQLEGWVIQTAESMRTHRRCQHSCITRHYMTLIHRQETVHRGRRPQWYEGYNVVSLLEKADGGSVRDIIGAKGSLTECEIRRVLQDTLAGLQYLHEEMQTVHNDVKPANILICSPARQGSTTTRYKLTDFDCSLPLESLECMNARLRAAADELPQGGCTSGGGTTLYMAPEVSLGMYRFAANDVWSLGISAFHMVSGSLPWKPLERQHPELITFNYREKFSQGRLFKGGCTEDDTGAVPGFGPNLEPIMDNLNCPSLLRDFICQCLREDPRTRPTCRQLRQHPFLSDELPL